MEEESTRLREVQETFLRQNPARRMVRRVRTTIKLFNVIEEGMKKNA